MATQQLQPPAEAARREPEIWRRITGCNTHEISSHGRARTVNSNIFLVQTPNRNVDIRPYVRLNKPGIDMIRNVGAAVNSQNQRVEELVMRHFTEEIDNLPGAGRRYAHDTAGHPYIIHLNLNPRDNYYRNLKRATYEEYFQYLEDQQRLGPENTWRIIRSRRPNSIYNPVLFPQDVGAMPRRKINQLGQVTNLKNMNQMSKIYELKSGIKFFEHKNSVKTQLDYPVSEVLVDTFYELDMTRPFIIHLDGDITNSVLSNLQRANFQEFVEHASNMLKIEEDEVYLPVSYARHNLKGFLVSNYGRLYSLISNRYISIQESEGSYSMVTLCYRDADGAQQASSFLIHCLVYSSHHRMVIPEGMVIDHFDMDKQNNKLENLDLVTPAVNSQRCKAALREWRELLQTNNFEEEEADLEQMDRPGETWLPASNRYERNEDALLVPDYYHVSNFGRIKNTRTGRVLKQCINSTGYKYLNICGRHFRVHRIVAMTYVTNRNPDTKTVVDHKDGDRQNNLPSNLEWVTPQMNNERAQGTQVMAIPVDEQGRHGEPLIFPSIAKACQHSFGQTKGAIKRETLTKHLLSGALLYGHVFRKIASVTDEDSAGTGSDLQNRGLFVGTIALLRQEFNREEEEIQRGSDSSSDDSSDSHSSNDTD